MHNKSHAMQYENLLLQEENGVLVVTLNREKALNALNTQTMLEIKHLFEVDAPRRTIRGVIITGAGQKAFVAGADISEFLELDVEKGTEMAQRGHDAFFAIERFPKPVIAAVNGFALGGGCELAMACHLRIASENARFGQPEVNLGIIPGYGGTQRLIQYIGKGKALELLLTGDMLSAAEALSLGLVNHVTTQEELLGHAFALMDKITAKGPIAVTKVIEAVNTYFDFAARGFDFEAKTFGAIAGTEDFKEGASAFLEKRKPEFKGK
jgi:enoyl-CoA hydratase